MGRGFGALRVTRRRFRGFAALGSAAALMVVCIGVAPARATSSPGAAWSWGANAYGELGNGTTSTGATKNPVQVKNLPPGGVTAIVAGARHSLAIRCDGAVVAWGKNTSGELGNGLLKNSSTPVVVKNLGPGSGVIAVDGNAPPKTLTNTTGNGHSMALKANGAVLGWGNNASGEVGNGTMTTPVVKPVTVSGLGAGSGVVAIAAGGSFSMALKSDGTVLAWGNNTSGEIGNGSAGTTNVPTPSPVSGLSSGSGVTAIAAGTAFGMALKSNGTVWEWGDNHSGELGIGSTTDAHTPQQVSGLSNVIAISAGDAFALALESDGSVWSWGNNTSGQLGNGTITDSSSPGPVTGLGSGSGVVDITTGFAHAIARTASGSLYGWGDDKTGELGDGGTANKLTKESLPFTNAAVVSAGGAHTLALHPLTFTTTASVGDGAVMEGDTKSRSISFPVTLSHASTTKVSVDYALVGTGSATGGTDYVAASGVVTFTPLSSLGGMTPVQKNVTAKIVADTIVEPNETFNVVLSSPCGCVLGRTTGQGTILDDDPAVNSNVTVGVGGGSIVVSGTAGSKLTFPVTLSKPMTKRVTVAFTLADGTATSGGTCSGGVDFAGPLTGTVTFLVSTTTHVTPVLRKISVPICSDPGPDTNEDFTVTLSSLTGLPSSQLIAPSATGTILGS
jgi:regulator of chromosome condensation (RCC1) repeat-containing protein/Regulator of Chromosome Condensation (RCC1) repeat protein/Calx-beta domain-containing protein